MDKEDLISMIKGMCKHGGSVHYMLGWLQRTFKDSKDDEELLKVLDELERTVSSWLV